MNDLGFTYNAEESWPESNVTRNECDGCCGCRNFFVISYCEIRLLELEVIKRLYSKGQEQFSMDAVDQYVKVDVDQFHGIEITQMGSGL
jgi:hypothetical protein